MVPFAHLHVHSEYSLLDGACRIEQLVERVSDLGQTSCALTDHGVMYGVIDFYRACKAKGIHPVIGCEVYLAPHSRHERGYVNGEWHSHLILLCENMTGYKNLIHMVSLAFSEGFYMKPRIDMELLREHSEGLICMSACLAGAIPRAIANSNMDKAYEICEEFLEIFDREHFYLEIQDHGIEEQKKVNEGLYQLAQELNLELVATNDAHYLTRADARTQDILMAIQMGKTVDDPTRMKFETQEFYIKDADEMAALFPEHPEALANTVKIAERCQVDFEFGKYHLPEFDVPEGYTSLEYLQKLCDEGFERRYPDDDGTVRGRLQYEIDMIAKMGFVDYFLIVSDFIGYAKSQGIPVGPGRGSAAGSIVSYCLGITDLDPIHYSLYFERFLNPERVSMPDIDVDFCYVRRPEVIEYVTRKYGKDRVAQIVTFGTMAARGAIRDVGRALNIPYNDVDAVAKQVPNELHMTIEKALTVNPELKKMYDGTPQVRELIDTARKLEGMPRNASTHAAGVVITKNPVDTYVPLSRNGDQMVTQFTMVTIEELGLLKMDFLGLRNLTVIADAEKMIRRHTPDFSIEKVDMNDPATYEMLGKGSTMGVFQLESAGITNVVTGLRPQSIEDITAVVALYRPGPMDFIPKYIKGKSNFGTVTYLCPQLEPILSPTYGCIVYQEQVMQIVQNLAGYTMGQADNIRRAMSKKKQYVIDAERQNFVYGNEEQGIKGCIANGISEQAANQIYDSMVDFAKYAFNKSHAAAYAVVAYQTAYLKYYYPVEFMAALMTSVIDNTRKVAEYIYSCRQMGIKVLSPDINEGEGRFLATKDGIRYGMYAIKSIGRQVIDIILAEREANGKYTTLSDFLSRVAGREVNKRAVENLIKAGACDGLDGNRQQMLLVYNTLIDNLNQEKKNSLAGQMSLFDLVSEEEKKAYEVRFPNVEEYSKEIKLGFEKEVLGIYLSGHPLEEYEEKWRKNISAVTADFMLDEETNAVKIKDNQSVVIGGIITEKTIKYTKQNKAMAFITVEDLFGTVEVIIFPRDYEKYSRYLNEDEKVFVAGHANVEEDKNGKLICEKIYSFDDTKRELWLQFATKEAFEEKEKELYSLLYGSDGNDEIVIYIASPRAMKRLGQNYNIHINPELVGNLTEFLGEKNVKIVEKSIEKKQ